MPLSPRRPPARPPAEELFAAELRKYDDLVLEVDNNASKSQQLLDAAGTSQTVFKRAYGYADWRKACEVRASLCCGAALRCAMLGCAVMCCAVLCCAVVGAVLWRVLCCGGCCGGCCAVVGAVVGAVLCIGGAGECGAGGNRFTTFVTCRVPSVRPSPWHDHHTAPLWPAAAAPQGSASGLRASARTYGELRDNLGEGLRFYQGLQEAIASLRQQAGDHCMTRRIQRWVGGRMPGGRCCVKGIGVVHVKRLYCVAPRRSEGHRRPPPPPPPFPLAAGTS